MATLALGVAGAIAGSFFGPLGTSIGWSLGTFLGSALFPGPGQSGPRLTDLKLQTSSYGKMIPILYGAMRVGGNVIWTTDLQEHEHKTGGKGSGPEVKTWTYTASFAVLICEGPAQEIRRIWANNTLVYDTSGVSGPLPSIPITIYLGTDGQSPDPTMEGILGVGFVPANNGYVYCVFTDWDLGTFGNTLPSLNFEVVTTVIPTVQIYPVMTNFPVGPWRTQLRPGSPDPFIVSWTATDIRVANFPLSDADTFNASDLSSTGTATRGPEDFYPERVEISFQQADPIGLFNGQALYWDNVGRANGGFPFTMFVGVGTPYLSGSGAIVCGDDLGRLLPAGLWLMGCVQSSDHTQVYIFTHAGTLGTPAAPYTWYKIQGTPAVVVDSGPIDPTYRGVLTGMFGTCMASLGGHYIGTFENTAPYLWAMHHDDAFLFKIDETKTLTADIIIPPSGLNQLLPVPNPESPPDDFENASLYSPATGFCGLCFGNNITLLSRFPPDPAPAVTLSSIVEDISNRAGLASGDVDVTQLVDLVDGYIIEQQSLARDCIAPLQSAFFFNGVESNAQMKFVKLGAPPVVVIPDGDLAAVNDRSTLPPRVDVKRGQETDLPATLTINYVAGSANYQTATQYARRLVTRSQSSVTANLAINMSDSKAAGVAWTILMNSWLERDSFQIKLPRKYWYLEPTDVIEAGGYVMRIIAKRDQANGIIEIDGLAASERIWVQPAVGVTGSSFSTPTTPVVTQPTDLVLLDLPMIADTDNQQSLKAAYAGTVDSSWRGAGLYRSYDGGITYASIDSTTTSRIIGTASDILPDFRGGNIFDESNSVTIVVGPGGGDLESTTEINVLNGANTAVLASEVLQFKNAILTAPSTYILSGLLRGRRGTEWAMPKHSTNDTFVLLPVDDIAVPLSDFGQDLLYKPVSVGATLGATTQQDFINRITSLRCYSPVLLFGVLSGSDVNITWVRRTRIGGGWQNLADVPLSEASELYVLQIWNKDYTQVARIVTGLTSPAFTYTGAMQITDFGEHQKHIYITVGQIGVLGLGMQAGAVFDGTGAMDGAPLSPVTPYNDAPPVAPPAGGCTGTVYTTTIPWTTGDGGIVTAPGGFNDSSTWVLHFTTPATGNYTFRIAFFEYGGAPAQRHATLALSACGAPLIPLARQDTHYPQFWCYLGGVNPHPTQFPTFQHATTYYITVTVDTNGGIPMAYECDIEPI